MLSASEINKRHYERVWGSHEVLDPALWSTWLIIKKLAVRKTLEVGCGNKPRTPVTGGAFLDINSLAVERLSQVGGRALVFDLSQKFPFKDSEFNLVCAFEVLEHLENDKKILSELGRVLSKRGTALISFPLNMKYWVGYDVAVGHVRRYEPENLESFFGRAGFTIEKYAPIKITWPNRWQSPIFAVLVRWFPGMISGIQNWLELLPNSPLRRKLGLRGWTSKSVADLTGETTALFVLKKK